MNCNRCYNSIKEIGSPSKLKFEYIIGNQNYDNELIDKHSKLGIKLLNNSSATFDFNEIQISLTGFNRYTENAFIKETEILHSLNSKNLNLIMHHNPSHIDTVFYKHSHSIDLALSGHIHSGAIDMILVNGNELLLGEYRYIPKFFSTLVHKVINRKQYKHPYAWQDIHPHIVGLDYAWGDSNTFPINIKSILIGWGLGLF